MNYDWDFGILLDQQYVVLLGKGFLTTALLTLFAIVLGTPIGIVAGSAACVGRFPGVDTSTGAYRRTCFVIRALALTYIDVLRAIPLLLLILICYYGLPSFVHALAALAGEDSAGSLPSVSAFWTSVVALSFNLSAFIGDLVRGSAVGVSRGSILAARSLGMTKWLTWRRIVIPEVIRDIVPGITLLYITILKMSTLCSVVAVYELLHSAEAIIHRTYKPLELYCAVAAVFVIVIIPLSAISRRLERTTALLRRTA